MNQATVLAPESFQTEAGARWHELFLYLEKAFYMTEADELKTLRQFAASDPGGARLWVELIRQRRAALPH